MKRILCLLGLLFSLMMSTPVWAVAPFGSGEITGPWGEQRSNHIHAGVDVGGMPGDTTIYAPFDCYVEHGGNDGNGFNYWVRFRRPGDPYAYLFGDLDEATMELAGGPPGSPVFVKEGEPIGVIFDGANDVSTGTHAHFEVHADGADWANFYDSVDPVPILESWGVILSGYRGDATIYRNQAIPWGFEEFYKMGQVFSEIIKKWTLIANKAFTYLRDAMIVLTLILCIIDFCLPIVIGMAVSLRDCAVKVMKYSGLLALIWNWNKFTDQILLNFAVTVSTKAAGTGAGDVITENMSNPQLLMQKGIKLLQPGLDKAASFSTFDFMRQFIYILPLYFFTFVVLIAFVLLALYVTLTYLEFYISAATSVISAPFGAWKMMKFIPEGMVGHLVSSAFKLLLVSFMIAICVGGIKDLKPPTDIFKTTEVQTGVGGGGDGSERPADLVAIADEMAQKYGIPANLFEGFITTESSWNPYAVSDTGAQGLGQLMPGTAEELGCNNPFDPRDNLNASAKYIRQLMDRFNGDVDLAIAAYNVGPGRVEECGNTIPPEAVDYVNKVKANTVGTYSTNVRKPFTAEELMTFIQYCLGLLGIAYLTMKVPKTIMKHFGGKLELP